jgi:hypothetical protein
MDVSHFELIFKPQSPEDIGSSGPVDTVLQGYFLKITNLENRTYRYALEFVTVEPNSGDPNRSLSGKTVFISDQPSDDNSFGALVGGSGRYEPSTGQLTLAPRETILVAVLPAAFGDNPAVASPDYEVRGYVRLTLPASIIVREFFGIEFTFRIAQARRRVGVLVTAQNRGTYFQSNEEITDQTQASLPLCNGGACMRLRPEGTIFPFFRGRA